MRQAILTLTLAAGLAACGGPPADEPGAHWVNEREARQALSACGLTQSALGRYNQTFEGVGGTLDVHFSPSEGKDQVKRACLDSYLASRGWLLTR